MVPLPNPYRARRADKIRTEMPGITLIECSEGLGAYLGADGATDPGAAEPAITKRVFRQILLVIVLGKVELGSVADLGRDRAVARRAQPLLEALLRGLGGAALRVR